MPEAKTDKPNGSYVSVWGPLVCIHCGECWGGSGFYGRGIAFDGFVVHTACYPLAVNVKAATERLREKELACLVPSC
jgi:hypothetical protein